MFAPLTVFVDLETTGLSPREEGITEIGAIVLEEGSAPREWSTLIKPARPIPPEIARMTGITNEMVREAPTFAEVAPRVLGMFEGALLVAHNARFDYAFLKQSFARLGQDFCAPTLCTARLARELDPGLESAALDALAERYGLAVHQRHRALGDARLALELARRLAGANDAETLAAAVKRVMRRPSLPKHLPVDSLARIPDAPGVYLFYGLNEHPLYIGKAKSLRERVGAHFSADWGSDRGVRLSEELRRIEWIETAGELSALLLEAELVRKRMPAHNVRLRRRADAVALTLDDDARSWNLVAAEALPANDGQTIYGPFASRRGARAALAMIADEAQLCLKALGLEKRKRGEPAASPCFAWQVERCLGACRGEESADAHWQRFKTAIGALAMPPWRHDGPVELIERDPRSGREARFSVDRWRLCSGDPGEAVFDHEVFRILRPYVEGRKRKSNVILQGTMLR